MSANIEEVTIVRERGRSETRILWATAILYAALPFVIAGIGVPVYGATLFLSFQSLVVISLLEVVLVVVYLVTWNSRLTSMALSSEGLRISYPLEHLRVAWSELGSPEIISDWIFFNVARSNRRFVAHGFAVPPEMARVILDHPACPHLSIPDTVHVTIYSSAQPSRAAWH